MIKQKNAQKGQALVMIALAIVGLVGITGLAIDGGNIFSERRRAQNAADTAALGAALAKVNANNIVSAATNYVNTNMDGGSQVSNMIILNPPGVDCAGNINGPYFDNHGRNISNQYIQVRFDITVDTYFAQVVGISQTHSCVEAIARAKPGYNGPLLYGNAVVGLNPDGTSFLAQSNAQYWNIRGGGIFSNSDAFDKHSNVNFPDGHCVTAVKSATGFVGCTPIQNKPDLKLYPDEIRAMLPQYDEDNCDDEFCPPPCLGVAVRGVDGKLHPDPSLADIWSGSRVDHFEDEYTTGLYCIEDAGGNINSTVSGTGVTFYFLDQDFTMKYAGAGAAITTTAPISSDNAGPYENYLMFSDVTPHPCTQNLEIRGNGTTPVVGTIFLPSACIDYRGNSNGTMYVQMIGYNVSSNGTADLNITYNAHDQALQDDPGLVELAK